LRRRDGLGNAAPPIRADDQPAALAQPIELEGGEKQVQQAGVVGVARVLRVHFPVARENFDEPTNDFYVPATEYSVEPRQHFRADKVLDSGRLIGEGAEYEAVERRHA
jgi:hypothetical protein